MLLKTRLIIPLSLLSAIIVMLVGAGFVTRNVLGQQSRENAAIEQTEGQAVALDALVSIFRLTGSAAATPVVQLAEHRAPGARRYAGRTDGLARDWSEF